MKRRVHVFVSGRVQGVCYRDFARASALSLRISGWVRNLLDGRVELMAEGEESDLEQFLARLQQGPSAARVDNLDVSWQAAGGGLCGFEIRY